MNERSVCRLAKGVRRVDERRLTQQAMTTGQVDTRCDHHAETYLRYRHVARLAAIEVLGHCVDVDDVVQETFERLMRSADRGCGPTASVSGYVRQIAHNVAVRFAQRRKRGRELEEMCARLDLWNRPVVDCDESILDRDEVIHILRRVPHNSRFLLWAIGAEGRNLADVSHDVATTPAALAAHLYRVRQNIRRDHHVDSAPFDPIGRLSA
jgi:DNA-directed RNA polymerase specialized sigma24 family protein